MFYYVIFMYFVYCDLLHCVVLTDVKLGLYVQTSIYIVFIG